MLDTDETFLAEQLERMRRLSERMSQVHSRVVENSTFISRDRDHLHSPLADVRDLRTHQTHDYPDLSKRRRRR
jgi:aspartyl aminopeptidase